MKTKNLLGLIAFIFIIGFSSCEKENAIEMEKTQPVYAEQAEAYPLKGNEAIVSKLFYGVETKFRVVKDGKGFVIGDMVLNEAQIDATNNEKGAISNKASHKWVKWTSGYYKIPYRISSKMSAAQSKKIKAAMKHWEDKTDLIRFIYRQDNIDDYIRFKPDESCWSYIGKQGGKQEIGIADWASTGNVIHEIGHALGLFHEHAKPDRDSYITANWSNIKDGAKNNFNKASGVDHYWGVDYGSIMIYGSYAFSKNNKATITKKNGTTWSAQRKALSNTDVAIINYLYD